MTSDDRSVLAAFLKVHHRELPELSSKMGRSQALTFGTLFESLTGCTAWQPHIQLSPSREVQERRLDLRLAHQKKLKQEIEAARIRVFDHDRIAYSKLPPFTRLLTPIADAKSYLANAGIAAKHFFQQHPSCVSCVLPVTGESGWHAQDAQPLALIPVEQHLLRAGWRARPKGAHYSLEQKKEIEYLVFKESFEAISEFYGLSRKEALMYTKRWKKLIGSASINLVSAKQKKSGAQPPGKHAALVKAFKNPSVTEP